MATVKSPSLERNTYTSMHSHTVADHAASVHAVLWSTKLIRKQSGLFPCHTLGAFTGPTPSQSYNKDSTISKLASVSTTASDITMLVKNKQVIKM